MKRTKNTIQQVKKLILVAVFSLFMLAAFAQNPPPPPGGGSGSENNAGNQLGGNAQIGGGVLILLVLGLAYGGKRLYDLKKQSKEEVA